MVPVASGVMLGADEGGRRIDLAHRCSPGSYEFIELKLGIACDTPLHAAMEILEYGLIYVFSRVHLDSLGYDRMNELLRANAIALKVLAPAESYLPGSLEALEQAINFGLAELWKMEKLDFKINFAFEQFPLGFRWSGPPEVAPAGLEARRRTY
jgi:hypothetical protein